MRFTGGLPTTLSKNFFLHYHFTLEVKFSLVPVCTVRKMMLTSGRIDCKLLCCCLVVGSSFISPGFRGFSFRIWHSLQQFILISSVFPSEDQCHLHYRRQSLNHRTCKSPYLQFHPRPQARSGNGGEVFSSALPVR